MVVGARLAVSVWHGGPCGEKREQTQVQVVSSCEWVLFIVKDKMQTKADHGRDLNQQNNMRNVENITQKTPEQQAWGAWDINTKEATMNRQSDGG